MRIRRYTEKELHPMVFEATKAFAAIAHSGATDADYLKVYTEHQKSWWKAYGTGFLMGLVPCVGLIGGAIALSRALELPRPMGAFAILGAIALVAGYAIIAYKRNQGQITIEELRVLREALPGLIREQRLKGVFGDYLDTIIELESSGTVDEVEKTELREQLNTMLSEAVRLQGQYDSLAAAHGNFEEKQKLAEEIKALELRIQNAKDADARDALANAKAIALKRLDSFELGGPVMERIEAQLELMRQTLRAFKETLARLRGVPSVGSQLEMGGLREQLVAIQTQSQALESAFHELNVVRLTD